VQPPANLMVAQCRSPDERQAFSFRPGTFVELSQLQMATKENTINAAETTIELVLQLVVANVPVKVRGSLKDQKLEAMSGLVKIDKSLNMFLDDLGADFSGASEVLKQLTGGPDINLDSLGFGYRNEEPKFIQLAVTFIAGDSRCRFVALKSVGRPAAGQGSGYVVGVELRLDSGLFKNNPISGLVGEISLGDMGLYYSSDTFQNVAYDSRQVFQDADVLVPEAASPARSNFNKGLNWSAQVFVRGVNVLEGLATSDEKKIPVGGPPLQPANPATPQLKGPTSWIEINKSVGPLTIRRIGLRYDAPRVIIQFDASVQLNVLTLSLLGLGVSYPLDKFTDLKDPAKFFSHLGFTLDGAAVTFQRGPLLISGGLLIVSRSPLQLDGTLLISIPGLQIAALGSYADLAGTPSLFVFVALQRELGGPAFFFVTGLAFGFGINRALKLPAINEVQNFPLVKVATDPDYLGKNLDLRSISDKLREYLPPTAGNFWIAAGIKFTSFGQIDSFALLSISLGTQFQIALLGLSKIWIPKPPAPVIAYAELAMKAVFSPESGVLSFEARLTENSYILRRDFKLRGGFAFFSWFAGEHAGDFVVSLGGYHPRFQPPAHYPRPDLVQFYSSIGDVTLQGSCYFALCPSAIMAGGSLSLVFDSGGIRAWFIAYANFLVQWKPLHYDIEIAISVGVALDIKVLFVRVHLSFELSASVNLFGPPLGGTARISLYIVSFTVRFGEDKIVPPPLLWESNDTQKSFAKSFLLNPDVTQTLISDGLIDELKRGDQTIRLVNPHKLVVGCRTQAPGTAVNYNGRDAVAIDDLKVNGAVPVGTKPWWNQQIGIRPMGKSQFYSLLDVSFAPSITASAEHIQKMMRFLDQYIELSVITKNLPRALWGTDALNPNVPASANEQIVNGALVGLEIRTKAGPRPWETPALDLKILSYDPHDKRFAYARIPAKKALPDYRDKTISSTVNDPVVAARRAVILKVLRSTGRRTMNPEDVHLDQLQKNARYIFQTSPIMARVGQYPPRGYLET
jgi:hypothetical protein